MTRNDLVALVDLGDTLADCTPTLRTFFSHLRQSGENEEDENLDPLPPYLELRRQRIMSAPGFWRNLPPRPQGIELAKVLQNSGFNLHVLTKGPYEYPHVWAEKVAWCHAYLPDVPVTVTEDKARVHGSIIVDDWLPYINNWQSQWPTGLAIIPAHPWNNLQPLGPRCLRVDEKDPDMLSRVIKDFLGLNRI